MLSRPVDKTFVMLNWNAVADSDYAAIFLSDGDGEQTREVWCDRSHLFSVIAYLASPSDFEPPLQGAFPVTTSRLNVVKGALGLP